MYRDEECLTHHKQLFCPWDMLRCWDHCLEKAQYHQRQQAIQCFNAHNYWKKRGICIVPLKFGIGFSKGFYNQVRDTYRQASPRMTIVKSYSQASPRASAIRIEIIVRLLQG